MIKHFSSVLVFALGLLCGALLYILLVSRSSSNSGPNQVPDNSRRRIEKRRELAAIATPLSDSSLSRLERLEMLTQALDQGTIDSLQQISSRNLHALPDYQTRILPALKIQGLEALLVRFTSADWENWDMRTRHHVTPTRAREYVDEVKSTNPELGRFLDTGAELFHRLSLRIHQGLVIDLQSEMEELARASSIESSSSPARLEQDLPVDIIADPSFVAVFERLRADLTAKRLVDFPLEVERNLELLNALRPDSCSPTVWAVVTPLLERLSLETSAKFREQLVLHYDFARLREFAQRDRDVKAALANFFALVAADFLLQGDLSRATTYLDYSTALVPGLRAQAVVREYLGMEANKPTPVQITPQAKPEEKKPVKVEIPEQAQEKEKPIQSADQSGLFGEGVRASQDKTREEENSGSFLSVFIVLVVLGGLGFAAFKLYGRITGFKLGDAARNTARAGRSAGKPGAEETESSRRRSLPDSEDFAETFEPEWLDPVRRRASGKSR